MNSGAGESDSDVLRVAASSAALAHVLPRSWLVPAGGGVELGGCDVGALLRTHGSPLYVYCEATLEHACTAFADAFGAHDAEVEFSAKAMPLPAVAAVVARHGLRADVVSAGELAMMLAGGVWTLFVFVSAAFTCSRALRCGGDSAGLPAPRINYHGNNKTEAELADALDRGVGRITIDSQHELARLERLAAARNVRQRVLLRVSPSVDPHTHLLTTTGVLDSKFGFSIETGAAEQAIAAALDLPHIDLVG